jgi:hypothetical protein
LIAIEPRIVNPRVPSVIFFVELSQMLSSLVNSPKKFVKKFEIDENILIGKIKNYKIMKFKKKKVICKENHEERKI